MCNPRWLIYICFLFSTLKAQFAEPFSHNDSCNSFIKLYGTYALNSSALTTNLLEKIYLGKYIDRSVKDDIIRKLQLNNRFGVDATAGVFTSFKPDSLFQSTQLQWLAGFRTREHLDINFTHDLFELAFYGNKRFEDKTALLSGTQINLLRFQEFQLGLWWTLPDSVAKMGFTINAVKGTQSFFLNASKAELFTATDGQSIAFNSNMIIRMSDTVPHRYFDVNGLGCSADLFFQAPYTTKWNEGIIYMSISDVGFINWNKNSLNYNKDTSYQFSGFNIPNIFDLNGSTLNKVSRDSLKQKLSELKHTSNTISTPAVLNIYTCSFWTKNFQFVKGVRHIFNASYKPYFYLQGNYYINYNNLFTVNAGYGGYGKYAYGLGYGHYWKKKCIVQLNANNVEGFLFPKKKIGQEIYLNFIKRF